MAPVFDETVDKVPREMVEQLLLGAKKDQGIVEKQEGFS
jgi:hypothetical protein